MNRKDRRAHARNNRQSVHPGHSLDCGCTVRIFEPLEVARCGNCGTEQDLPSGMMPTSTPIGSTMTVFGSCPCGSEVEVTVQVVA